MLRSAAACLIVATVVLIKRDDFAGWESTTDPRISVIQRTALTFTAVVLLAMSAAWLFGGLRAL